MAKDTGPVPFDTQSAELQDQARLAVRLGTEYALRSVKLLATVMGGDLIATFVVAEIVAANTAHLNATQSPRYTALNDLPPDSERRPVSALAVAGSVGLPRETVRRCIKKLEALGVIQQVRGGFIVPTAVLGLQPNHPALMANVANLRQLVGRLRDIGYLEP